MKKIMAVFPLISLIVFLGLVSCEGDDNDGCFTPEELVSAECLAEAIDNVCEPLTCGATINTNEGPIAIDFFLPAGVCEVIDCDTLQCGQDTLTDIEIDDDGSITGAISTPDGEGTFGCQ